MLMGYIHRYRYVLIPIEVLSLYRKETILQKKEKAKIIPVELTLRHLKRSSDHLVRWIIGDNSMAETLCNPKITQEMDFGRTLSFLFIFPL